MTVWKISYSQYWCIYGDGKELARCDDEESAILLLNAIMLIEKSNELLEKSHGNV